MDTGCSLEDLQREMDDWEFPLMMITLTDVIDIMVRVFANGLGDLGSISRSSDTKDSKNGT